MNRNRSVAVWGLLLLTALLLLTGEPRGAPAAIWPSVLAVALAFITRDIYSSLFLGAFAGTVLLANGNIVTAFVNLFTRHMIPPLTDRWNVSALVFSLMMGGFVELLNRIGGMRALARIALGRGDSRRRAGLGVFAMGWVVFFDGLASSMLVGKTMRPVTDRAGMSREKLAFIVDSTSSPIAAFALISTWIAFELTMIQNGLALYGDSAFNNAQSFAGLSSYQILIQTLPYRFYNYFVLLIVFLTIWLGRDLGPMREAERKASPRGDVEADRAEEEAAADGNGWRSIVLTLTPLALLVVSVFGGLYLNGLANLESTAGFTSMERIIQAFGAAEADLVFVTATAFASVVALLILRFLARPGAVESPTAVFFEGMRQMFLPVLILVFAFSLSSVIRELETANWLVRVLDGNFPVAALPAVVFLLAAVMSFSVGSSWGTMGLLTPLCIPIAGALTGLESGAAPGPVVIATIGAVLAGAVFGDHCSPISDTTIVSAFASGCDAVDHVRTQIPYALVGAGIAVTLGYLPAGMGVSPFPLLVLGAIACWAIIRFAGSRSPDPGRRRDVI
jgi:Na+/H+ antiporter NhaC